VDEYVINGDGTECIPCDDNCATCENETDECTSCYPPLYLDEDDLTCLYEVPSGKFFDEDDFIIKSCDANCAECFGEATWCIECDDYLFFDPDDET